MDSAAAKTSALQLNQRLATSGFRFTAQRELVYGVLLEKQDHPTAEDVFLRAKRAMPEISMATVYNCLDALVQCNLVRQVNLDRNATRFCPNMEDHCHFYCDDCGGVFDIDLTGTDLGSKTHLPDGFTVSHCEISFRGCCHRCSGKRG